MCNWRYAVHRTQLLWERLWKKQKQKQFNVHVTNSKDYLGGGSQH